MLTILRVSLLITACAFFSACSSSSGGDANAPKAPAADAPAAEHAVHLFERLAHDLRAAGSDCDAVARTLDSFNERHASDYPTLANQARQSDIGPDARAAYDERLRVAMSGILDRVEACENHTEAQRAFTEFDVLVDPR